MAASFSLRSACRWTYVVSTDSWPSPKRDHGSGDAAAQQIHRGGVAQNMGRDALALQRGAGLPGDGYVLGQQVGEPVVTQRAAALVGEDGRVRFAAPLFQPGPQRRRRILA